MIRATWNGTVLAESDKTVVVEGNHYFPPESLHREYFEDSPSHTRCFWKGKASYYNVVADGQTKRDAAWYYPNPSRAAAKIANYVAFSRGVQVGRVRDDDAGVSAGAGGSFLSRLLRR